MSHQPILAGPPGSPAIVRHMLCHSDVLHCVGYHNNILVVSVGHSSGQLYASHSQFFGNYQCTVVPSAVGAYVALTTCAGIKI